MIRYKADRFTLYNGDSSEILPRFKSEMFDCIICDPPYAEVDRKYGRWSEEEWHKMMDIIVPECKRILKPHGSAVFIIQPSTNGIGSMHTWVWEFMVNIKKRYGWNIIQDVYWWNHATPPSSVAMPEHGLMRPSVKYCVWVGNRDCYRNQKAILWKESETTARMVANITSIRSVRKNVKSGHGFNNATAMKSVIEKGGVTPFNLIPLTNSSAGTRSVGSHDATTPEILLKFWIAYLAPTNSLILDPFNGSGTTGEVALNAGHRYIGIERKEEHYNFSIERLTKASLSPKLWHEFGEEMKREETLAEKLFNRSHTQTKFVDLLGETEDV